MIRTARLLAWTALLASAAGAQEPSVDRARIEQLRSLPPEKIAELRRRLEMFKKLPGDEQQRLRENLQKLKNMAPDQVKKLRERTEKLTDVEKKEYSDLASGFFRWANRSRQLDGFPRGLFFTWLKKEKPEKIEEIRAMEPGPGGPRVDALVKLCAEFREVVLNRVQEHVRRHRCAPPEGVAALRDVPPQEFWRKFQEMQRGCPLSAPKAPPGPPLQRPAEKHPEKHRK